MLRLVVFLFLTLFSSAGFSQNIRGKLTDNEGRPIPIASVVIKEVDSVGKIITYKLVQDSEFSFTLLKPYPSLYLQARAVGYTTAYYQLSSFRPDSTYQVNLRLNQRDEVLREVTVEAERYPVEVKQDTTVYEAAAFTRSTDRKVEDILKNMPGIQVDEASGLITYKGKAVEAVMIEGSDMFEGAYTIATQGINADVIAQVEAIENYHENRLLSSLEGSDKVALNLKLKANKLSLSGSAEGGAGFDAASDVRYVVNSNALGISKKLKNYVSFSANSVGATNTKTDQLIPGRSAYGNLEAGSLTSRRVISLNRQGYITDENRENLNQELAVSATTMLTIKQKGELRLNTFYDYDRPLLMFESGFTSLQAAADPGFAYLIQNKGYQQQRAFRSKLSFNYYLGSSSRLEYKAALSRQRQNQRLLQHTPGGAEAQTYLRAANNYLSQQLLYTKKLDSARAIQLELTHSASSAPQHYQLQLPFALDERISISQQHVDSQLSTFGLSATLLGRRKKAIYSNTVGIHRRLVTQNAYAQLTTQQPDTLFSSPVNYRLSSLTNSGSLQIPRNRWNFILEYQLNLLDQQLRFSHYPHTNPTQLNLTVSPALGIQYQVTANARLVGRVNRAFSALADQHLLIQPHVISQQSWRQENPSLQLRETTTYFLQYYYSNVYSQSEGGLILNHTTANGNYLAAFRPGRLTLGQQIHFVDLPQQTSSAKVNAGRYFDAIGSQISLSSSVSRNTYINQFYSTEPNPSEWNESLGLLSEHNFSWRTVLDLPVNIRLSSTLRTSQIKGVSSDLNAQNKSMVNSAQLIIQPNKCWLATLELQRYDPFLTQEQRNYYFTDITLYYRPAGKAYELVLLSRNLGNISHIALQEVNSYAISTYQRQAIPRYFMLHFAYTL